MCDKNSVGRRYGYLASELDNAYHVAALKCGLSDSAMWILYIICLEGEECPLSDIVRLSGISKQTINSSLRKLEQEGILYLKTADKKKKVVCLTEKGRCLAESSAMLILRIEDDIFQDWSQQERELYIRLMERFLSEFKEKIKKI